MVKTQLSHHTHPPRDFTDNFFADEYAIPGELAVTKKFQCVAAMGMAADLEKCHGRRCAPRGWFVFRARVPLHSGHGAVALFLPVCRAQAISPRPLQVGQAPSGLLKENKPRSDFRRGRAAVQANQAFAERHLASAGRSSFSEGIRTLMI